MEFEAILICQIYGLEFIFDDVNIKGISTKTSNINEFKNYVNNSLDKMITDIEGLKDDCTLLAIEIN